MISNFKYINTKSTEVVLDLENPTNFFHQIHSKQYQCYYEERHSHIGWNYNNKEIIISDTGSFIKGLPSVCKKFVIAIFQGKNGAVKNPNNIVIYNLDGTKHKQIVMPKLLSELCLKRIDFHKESNPPIESAKYEDGLRFNHINWKKNKQGVLINVVTIVYDRDWLEFRVLNVNSGEVEGLVGQGKV